MSSYSICSPWSFSSPGYVGGVDEQYLLLLAVLEDLIHLIKSITEDPAALSLLDELVIISEGTDDDNEQPADMFNSAAVGNRSAYFVKCKLVGRKQYQTPKFIVSVLSLQCAMTITLFSFADHLNHHVTACQETTSLEERESLSQQSTEKLLMAWNNHLENKNENVSSTFGLGMALLNFIEKLTNLT